MDAIPIPVADPFSSAGEIAEANLPLLTIEPSRGWVSLRLNELWTYRELLYFLTLREIKVRYKQTAFGAAWAVIQPLFTMLIFSLFFGRLAKMPSDGIPYPLFALTALIPWTFFANGITQSSSSLVTNSHLVSKVYFPRLIVPFSAIATGIVDVGISFILLLGMLAFYHKSLPINIVWLPPFFILTFLVALGAGLWLSALNVQYRDVRYAVPFLVQFWMYATPIAYPASLLHGQWRAVYGLNPMVGVADGFRWAILGAEPPRSEIVASSVTAILILASGALYFRRMEKTFADLI
jgi:lipopolysaccharide transport system permease protein